MQPEIKILSEKKLIGKKLTMSFVENHTPELWRSFMPRRNEISNKVNNDLISMQIYESGFLPNAVFEKWSTVEVSNFDTIPAEMESFTLQTGLYAVFFYKGLSTDNSIFQYIFEEWLPNSEYELDIRPHFEVLGEKYKNNDPSSEEEIWIPIKSKS
jgi:AraC family transcriptional regulator